MTEPVVNEAFLMVKRSEYGREIKWITKWARVPTRARAHFAAAQTGFSAATCAGVSGRIGSPRSIR